MQSSQKKSSRWIRSYLFSGCAVCVWIGLSSEGLAGFVTFGNGFGSKWGDPIHGTPSDVITWTFMSDSTPLHATNPLVTEVVGNSNITVFRNTFDTANGTGAFDGAIQRAFNTWAAAASSRITFQFVPVDTGAASGNQGDPNAYATDIRIGAFTPVVNSSFSFTAGVGFGPPGNDLFFPDALAGDILLNLNAPFFIAPGQEGDIHYTGGLYRNDMEGLMLHELGHAAIGLGHPSNGIGDVMYVDNFPNSVNFVNRQLSPDDIAGAQTVYGVAIPEPSSCLMVLAFAIPALAGRRR